MFEMIILSLIQSVTEFLPVSSSGHLLLANSLGFTNQSFSVDVALHVGTLFSLLCYFWKDIWHLFTGIWHKGSERRLFFCLCISTLPILIVGLCGYAFISTTLRNPFIVAFTAIFFGLLLWTTDISAKKTKSLSCMTLSEAFYIGLAQVLSLIPGTSRSGITITCARALGFKREEAAKFSMLLSIPTIGMSAVYILWLNYKNYTFQTLLNPQLAFGFILTALFGLLTVWFLMKWVKKASFGIFAVYRILLGLGLIIYFL